MNQQPEYQPMEQALPPIDYRRARRRIAVPAFATALEQAKGAGVGVFALTCLVEEDRLEIRDFLN